jgi:DNA-binding GntR family transcriptional regulator
VATKSRANARSSIEISEEILKRIRKGKYAPGDTLSQYELAAEFATSRTPIREALRFLEAKRVISLTDSGRAVVTAPTLRGVREAFQIRAELEGLAAQLAVDWITERDLKDLRICQDKYAQALRSGSARQRTTEWVSHNETFHRIIAVASRNERLIDFIAEMQSDAVGPILGYASQMPHGLMEENIKQHEEILGALERRDGKSARAAMTNHILRTTEIVTRWMEAG